MSTYTVVSGDTMWKIANDHGVTLDALIAANPQIPDPSMIAVGQVVNIPTPPQNPPAPAPAPEVPAPGPAPGTPGPIFNPSPSHPTPSNPGGLKTVAYFTNWVRSSDRR